MNILNINKISLAFVSAGLLTLGFPNAARADVMASSMINMTNFTISSGGTQLDASDLSYFTFTSSADYSGSLSSGSFTSSSSSAPIDFMKDCVGSGCGAWNTAYGADNSYTKLFAAPVGNYAAADQSESGAPITGIAGFSSPANLGNATYTGLTSGSDLASSNSNNNLNSSFIFSLNKSMGLTFDFLVNAYLQASITADEIFPSFATASYQMDFTLVNLSTNTTVWTFAPDLFGDGVKTLSLNAPLPINIQTSRNTGGSANFNSTTSALVAGDLYQLSARMQTNADVQRVPEPGVLALLGMGIFGMALSRRRKAV